MRALLLALVVCVAAVALPRAHAADVNLARHQPKNDDVKFGACAALSTGDVPEHPMVTTMKNVHPMVFDAGDFVVGIKSIDVIEAKIDLLYEQYSDIGLFSINGPKEIGKCGCGADCKRAPVKLRIEGLVIKNKGTGSIPSIPHLTDRFDIDSVDLSMDLAIQSRGYFDPDRSRKDGVLAMDVNDARLSARDNDVSVCVDNMKHDIDSNGLVESVGIAIFDKALNLVAPQIQTSIGNFVKCFMRSGQPLFFAIMHEAYRERQTLLKMAREAKETNNWALKAEFIKKITGEKYKKKSEAEYGAEVNALMDDLVRELTQMVPKFSLAMSSEFTPAYHAKFRPKIHVQMPTNMLVNYVLDTGLSLFDSLDKTNEGTQEVDYLKRLLKSYLQDQQVEGSDIAALIKALRDTATNHDTKLEIVGRGIKVEVDSVERSAPPVALGGAAAAMAAVARLADRAPSYQRVPVVDMRAKRGSVLFRLSDDSKIPEDIILENSVCSKNRLYIQALCDKKYQNDEVLAEKCFQAGLLANKAYVAVSSSMMKQLYKHEESTYSGAFSVNLRDFRFSGPMDEVFWRSVAKARCQLSDIQCQDTWGLMGSFMEHNAPYAFIGTPQGDDNEGILITKTRFLINLEVMYSGLFHLGKIVAMSVNAAGYVQQQIRKGDLLAVKTRLEGALKPYEEFRHPPFTLAERAWLPSTQKKLEHARLAEERRLDMQQWGWNQVGQLAQKDKVVKAACEASCHAKSSKDKCCPGHCWVRQGTEGNHVKYYTCGHDQTNKGCYAGGLASKLHNFSSKTQCADDSLGAPVDYRTGGVMVRGGVMIKP